MEIGENVPESGREKYAIGRREFKEARHQGLVYWGSGRNHIGRQLLITPTRGIVDREKKSN